MTSLPQRTRLTRSAIWRLSNRLLCLSDIVKTSTDIHEKFISMVETLVKIEGTQQTQDVESMLVQRWSSVVDVGPTLNQR